MNRRSLHQDLLHSGKYRQQVVKAKKGKGAFSRHDKHKKHRHDESGGVFYGRCRRRLAVAPKSVAPAVCGEDDDADIELAPAAADQFDEGVADEAEGDAVGNGVGERDGKEGDGDRGRLR